jgi:hypothetical protein
MRQDHPSEGLQKAQELGPLTVVHYVRSSHCATGHGMKCVRSVTKRGLIWHGPWDRPPKTSDEFKILE